MTSPLPCLLIGGWLGAGKTTLVNQLLRQAQGRRLAVLVNDFGELGIDADLITGASDEVLELAGGCICCSYGADLIGALRRVAARLPRAETLLLETSGVSDPAAVARSLRLVDSVRLDSTVVVADAIGLPQQLADCYVGDTVSQQLRFADLVLLNKVDGIDAASLQALHRLLATVAPQAAVLESVHAEVPIAALFGLALDGGAATDDDDPAQALRVAAPAGGRYRSRSTLLSGAQDPPALAHQLTAAGSGVLRAKGLLTDAQGRRHLLQVVGRRAEISPAPRSATGPDRLVEIRLHVQHECTDEPAPRR